MRAAANTGIAMAVVLFAALWAITGGFEASGDAAQPHSYQVTIASPTASEDRTIAWTDVAITVTEVECVLVGGTSVNFGVQHSSDRNATGNALFSAAQTVDSTSTGDSFTTFSGASIAANSFIWLETSAAVDTPTELHCTVYYTTD